jgi:4-amino-4-deoxy-L-arabinose transferase-like glycosyltransferase
MTTSPPGPDPIRQNQVLASAGARGAGRWLEVAVVAVALLAGLFLRYVATDKLIFAGADSYSYTSAATELREHHRYGFRLPPWYPERPAEPPPGRCRPPGYPLLLAALGTVDEQKYSPFFERTKHVQWFIDIGTALLVYLLGRVLAGRLVGGLALGGYLLHPTAMAYTASIMTETLAVAVTTLALLLCAVAIDPRQKTARATRFLCGAGVVMALGVLVRADGILLAPCLLLPLVMRREALRTRARMVALALLFAGLTYSPWVLRNLHTFGAPYPLGSLCEIDGTPIEGAWFHRWYATWVRSETDLLSTQGCIYRRSCATAALPFPDYAFDSDGERRRVMELLRRQTFDGMTESIDEAFHALWLAKVRSHPLRSLFVIPVHRALYLWLGNNDLPVRGQPELAPMTMYYTYRLYSHLAAWTAWLAMSGLWALLFPIWRSRRRLLWLVLPAIVVRTGFLALLGFPEPRYILELLPLALILGSIAVLTPVQLLAARR